MDDVSDKSFYDSIKINSMCDFYLFDLFVFLYSILYRELKLLACYRYERMLLNLQLVRWVGGRVKMGKCSTDWKRLQ